VTITEWSHSGKFRAWIAGNRSAPAPYLPSYFRSPLIEGADFEVSHHGGWQDRIADVIYDQTGVFP
jgi:hypothetical protein